MNTKEIKNRTRAISNTRQVTRAMEMVSAVKMRKSQAIALATRPYALKALEILSHFGVEQGEEMQENILLKGRAGGKVIIVPLTSDKGLIGSFNANVLRESGALLKEYRRTGVSVELVVLGERSRAHYEQLGLPIAAHFKGMGDYAEASQTRPLSEYLMNRYIREDIKEIIVVYTEFISTLKQRVTHRKFLPITPQILKDIAADIIPESGRYAETRDKGPSSTPSELRGGKREERNSHEYLYEPNARELLETLLPILLDTYMYHIVLESNASEHSARMVAMKNASDNAKEILGQLTLSYNKARQSSITAQVNEIVAGAEALT